MPATVILLVRCHPQQIARAESLLFSNVLRAGAAILLISLSALPNSAALSESGGSIAWQFFTANPDARTPNIDVVRDSAAYYAQINNLTWPKTFFVVLNVTMTAFNAQNATRSAALVLTLAGLGIFITRRRRQGPSAAEVPSH